MRNIVFALSLCLLSAQAQFNYTTNNGGITITSYTGPGGSITIPDTINGLPVSTIGSYAFYSRVSEGIYLTSITIPSSVTNIGYYSFAENYPSLTGVYFLGNAPAYVNGSAFFGTTFGNPNPCNTVVYYFPGTAGWGPTLRGRPTLPAYWIANCRVTHGIDTPVTYCNLTITGGPTNMTVAVEACTNLAIPAWFPVGTVTLTSVQFKLSDFICQNNEWSNYPARFYRLRCP